MTDIEHDAIEPAEQSVQDVILEMLDSDADVADDVKDAVLSALAEVADNTSAGNVEADSTYLTSIDVVGFRGIGGQVRLDLYPAPGLTVVSGRNGSGKSSFAEALELALTGTSYRWAKKTSMWEESWRNLHRPHPTAIRIGFTAEGAGPFTVGLSWEQGADLTAKTSYTQTGGDRTDGTEGLGWARPLELSRPVLSYDELGRLFDGGPSALYDALAKLLGLEALADAEKWLATELKSSKASRDRAEDERKRVMALLADCADERAKQAAALLKKRGGPSLDNVLALATGSDAQGQHAVKALRGLATFEIPTAEVVGAAASRLRTATQNLATVTAALADDTRHRIELLQSALRLHDHDGDIDCPVCGKGRLDSQWASSARESVASAEHQLADYRAATSELNDARAAALSLIDIVKPANAVPGADLTSLAEYNFAAAAAAAKPAGDIELASHVEHTMPKLIGGASALRKEAQELLNAKESTWAPIAAQLGAWVPLEQEARELDSTVKTMTAAKNWLSKRSGPFRNKRLEAIAAQARKIWGQLRQESNVDLGSITLEGSATRRRAVLEGAVDGEPTKALPVMSQGELHALALALFIPRATAASSPFQFIVLDDPIQAMDPAKIDGFVQVLSEIAQTRQVIVFSHDDRLASTIRETGTDARLIEVVREAGSKVTTRDNVNPAQRQVNDVFALLKDDQLPEEIRMRVMPGLFRLAVEAAAKQAYYTKRSLAGESRFDSEKAWTSALKTGQRLSLAIEGDAKADLTAWLDAKSERRRVLRVCNSVHGDGMHISKPEAQELERTVHTLLALR